TSAGGPCRKSLRNSLLGLRSAGIGAPERGKLNVWLFSLLMARTSAGKRVLFPPPPAPNWARERPLRKPPRPGCRAAGGKDLSAACPPVTPGWLTPEKTVTCPRTAASLRR